MGCNWCPTCEDTADDYYNNNEIPMKKVSGSDVLPDNNKGGDLGNYRSEW